MTGAYHGSEITFTFNNLYTKQWPWTDEDRRIANMVSSYWANFAKSGNPNGAGLPHWAASSGAAETMEIGEKFAPRSIADETRLDFFRRFYATQKEW